MEQNPVRIIEKNDGEKIPVRQKDYKLIFGDDDLSIRCDRYQRDWPVSLDICADADRNLLVGLSRYYVAQIDIPGITYEETEDPDGETIRTPLPLDMGDVTVTLWAVDGLNL